MPIYTPGWREALLEKSVLSEITTLYVPDQARTRIQTRSGFERTNDEVNVPPNYTNFNNSKADLASIMTNENFLQSS